VSALRLRVIVVVLMVVAIVLLVALCQRDTVDELDPEAIMEEEIGTGIQSVVLAFGDRAAMDLVEERREIVVAEDRATRAKQILQELVTGPRREDAVRTIPPGTRVLSVFFDETGAAYVDFSNELLTGHPGGSTGELFTIRSVVRTLASNFPDLEGVQFLVEGEEIETIAGHIDASGLFDARQYR